MVATNQSSNRSRRIMRFRKDIIDRIPRRPNNRQSLQSLQLKCDTDLLIIYMCWRMRHVAARPRTVLGYSDLKNDSRFEGLKSNIEAFKEVVERGDDLAGHLSKKAHHDGYVMDCDPERINAATWEDKDLLLNVTGLHHFHLGCHQEPGGLMGRTDTVAFAHVSRDAFQFLGLFDHSAFELTTNGAMPSERNRLLKIRDEYMYAQAEPGVYLGGYGNQGITTSGTPVVVTLYAIHIMKLIRGIDPKLDNKDSIKQLFPDIPDSVKIEPTWHFDHLDFGLKFGANADFKCLIQWPN